MPTPNNQIPDALANRTNLQNASYVIGPVLGQGGFGITYWAGDVKLQRYVAIKELFVAGSCKRQGNSVQLSGNMTASAFTDLKSKFLLEARALAQFRHSGIVHAYNFFEENNTAYMVMEHLKGKTLLQLIETKGALPEAEAVGYIQKVAEALEVVHNAQMLHRDINPGNIMVCDDGRIVLIDFGLNKKIEAPVTGLGTRRLSSTVQLGTEGYAPPEQYVKQASLGTFTDIYSLGATLYFLLTAKEPVAAMERMYRDELPDVKETNWFLSDTINQAVRWAMKIKESERPQKLSEFVKALRTNITSNSAPSVTQSDLSLDLDCSDYQTKLTNQTLLPINSPSPKVTPVAKPSRNAFQIAPGTKAIKVNDTEDLVLAVENAEPKDTILLSSATYVLTEILQISKSLNLIGDGDECRIVSAIAGDVVHLVGNNEWEIQDIIFERSMPVDSTLLSVTEGSITLKRCFFNGKADMTSVVLYKRIGLNLSDNAKGVVEDCEFMFHDNGVLVYNSQPTLQNNRFEKNSSGIIYYGSAAGVAQNNICVGNHMGIVVYDKSQPTIIKNVCEKNYVGIQYWKRAAGEARDNICADNDYGIHAADKATPQLKNNQYSKNKKGDEVIFQPARIAAGSGRNAVSVSTVAGLEKAIQKAEPGDIIWLKSGIYRLTKTLYIFKSLTLKGDGGKCRIASAIEHSFLYLSGDNEWEIQDIAFERSVPVSSTMISISEGYIKLRRCTFKGIADSDSIVNQKGNGVWLGLEDETQGIIEDCEFRFHDNGILIQEQAQVSLERNRFEKNSNGICCSGQAAGVVKGNVFVGNWFGIHVETEAHPVLINNRCEKNDCGIIYSDRAGGIAQGNICVNNCHGILVEDAATPRLVKNQCSDNEEGDIIGAEQE